MSALQLALIGLCTGGLLALMAQGLVLVYRGSGVLNLAHASMATLAVFIYWTAHDKYALPFFVAALLAVVASAAAAALVHTMIMRRLRNASPLSQLIGTLAVSVAIQATLLIIFGSGQRASHPVFPTTTLTIVGLRVGEDRLWLLAIAASITLILHTIYKYSRFGLATTANAENPRAAAALGISSNATALINWVLGGAIAGLAGVLLASVFQVQLESFTGLIVPVVAAGLLGGMRSFLLTFAGGAVIGITQAWAGRYISGVGWGDAMPLILIIATLVIRGRGLIGRPSVRIRYPGTGSGAIKWRGLAALVSLATLCITVFFTEEYVNASAVTLCIATILLSNVVVIGYAGQLSLAQFTIAGIGADIAGLLMLKAHWPFLAAILAAMILSFPIGLLFGLPALRSRGISLAIVTVGLAASCQAVIFNNYSYTGGVAAVIQPPEIFGLDVNSFAHPRRYAIVCLVFFVLFALAVANLRRSRSGVRLLAMRANERAAAAVGVNVYQAKLFAFAVGAVIAAAGGALLTFRVLSPDYTQQFNVSYSIQGVLYTVLGGIGYVAGPLLGALGVPGGFISTIFAQQSDNFTNWVSLVLAVSTIFVLADAPDGVAHVTMRRLTAVVRKLSKPSSGVSVDAGAASTNSNHGVVQPPPSRLAISNLTVQFGQVTALEDFSCRVESGEILGIIGPNGAGKTTMIEAATGYIRSRHGEIILNGDRINRWPVQRRADRGLGRTFQSLELFEDLTVGENFCVGEPGHGWIAYLRDLVWPRRLSLSPSAEIAIRELKLQDQLGLLPTQLPYGDRRLVAIARSLAGSPSLLLLDEPAAGLGRLERRELAVLLRKLAKDWGLGIVLVEHDVDLVMDVCDTVIALAFGRIIASGTPVEVRHDPAVIAAYLGEQDGGMDEEISATV